MAVLGFSKLEAVQRMMASVGRGPPSSLDTGGASDAGIAELCLDHWITQVQTEGYEANYRQGVEYTASGAGAITFSSTVLKIQCVAPGRYAGRVVLKEDAAFCISENTANFGASTVLYFDIWEELTWDQCPPELKARILAAATIDFAARLKQKAELDQLLNKQLADADRIINRPNVNLGVIPKNTAPGGIPAVNSGRSER